MPHSFGRSILRPSELVGVSLGVEMAGRRCPRYHPGRQN